MLSWSRVSGGKCVLPILDFAHYILSFLLFVLSCRRYKFLVALNKGIKTPFQIFSSKRGVGRVGEAAHFI